MLITSNRKCVSLNFFLQTLNTVIDNYSKLEALRINYDSKKYEYVDKLI